MRHRSFRITALGLAGLLAATGLAWPANAATPSLQAMPYGVVDFGDGVDYTLAGAPCGPGALVRVTVPGGQVDGPVSTSLPAPAGGCAGIARVPSYSEVQANGWRQGDDIDIALISDAGISPLRYQRVEVDRGQAAAQPGTDRDTGDYDKVLPMVTGDSVDLGRVNVERVDAVSFRLCIPTVRPLESVTPGFFSDLASSDPTPVVVSIHQDSPDGPELLHPVDIAHDPTTATRLASSGFGDPCWRLVTVPVTGQIAEAAPNLFLKADIAPPGMLTLNSVDFDGTGARSQAVPNWVTPDPDGMQTIFDGTSFEGWTQSGCGLYDGAVTNERSGDRTATTACSMSYDTSAASQVIRLELRAQSFYDNGAINVPSEIQLRRAGEFGPGGYFPEYSARWDKFSSWPAWTQMEIIQIGRRYVVRVNGRTVTDHTIGSAPNAYKLGIATQPANSFRVAVANGFGDETPNASTPDEWGSFWFRNVRSYQCSSASDPICTNLLTINAGQAPAR